MRIATKTIVDLIERTPKSSFIDGAFVGGNPSLDVLNPNTGEVLTSVVSADASTAGPAALDAAVAVQASWASTTPRERSEVLRRAYDLTCERADDLAALMTLEMGKTLAEAYGEVSYGAEFLRWFSEEAVRAPGLCREAPAAAGNTIMTMVKPVGPTFLITPWNFPLSMATRKIAPALAAGCTVVLKPASLTPLTALAFIEILREAGVPRGVVNCVVTRESSVLSETLLADPRLRKVSFTGSTEVGRTLLGLTSQHVLNTSMELGGNAPFMVLPSANLEAAASALMAAKFRNNGQACTAANRIYVLKEQAEEFTRLVTEKAAALSLGHGLDEAAQLSALISAEAVDSMDEFVADAVGKGARITTGGERPTDTTLAGGFFYPATVLANVSVDARVCHEEIFGPITPIVVCDSVEQMFERANETKFGLMAYVMGENMREVREALARVDSGMVAVNVGVASDPAAPFGGVKESGLGREGSHAGLEEFLETVYVRIGG